MSTNTYSTDAKNFSDIAVTAVTPILAPLGKFSTNIQLNDRELPGQPSEIVLASAGPTVQTGTNIDYTAGNCTMAAITATPVHYVVTCAVSSSEYQIGLRPEHIIPITVRSLGNEVLDGAAGQWTTDNYGAAVVTRDSGGFILSDFEQMLASVSSSERCIVLDSAYFVRVKPATWHPPGFNSTFESNRWSAAGEKVHGFVAAPAAMVCRWSFPQLARPGWQVVARELGVIPGLQLPMETSLYLIPSSRQLRACFSIIAGFGVGDPNALKLLCSTS